MKTLAQIRSIKDGMQRDLDGMALKLAALNQEIAALQADGSRTPQWLAEKIRERRGAAMPAFDAVLGTFGGRLEELRAQRRFWADKALLLSRQRFDADPLKEATHRAARLAELEKMPGALLQQVADSALEDGDLATVHLCTLVGKPGQPGWRAVDVVALAIPEQAEALAAIQAAEGLAMRASDIVGEATGRPVPAVRRLQTARAMGPQALRGRADGSPRG